jgi:hypothetical protein
VYGAFESMRAGLGDAAEPHDESWLVRARAALEQVLARFRSPPATGAPRVPDTPEPERLLAAGSP